MKTKIPVVVGLALTLSSFLLRAGVSVNTNTPTEKLVAFRVLTNQYVTAVPNGFLDCSGNKINSKQKFTIIDLNGGQLTDGHEVQIRYTPSRSTKSNYWREIKDGIKRGQNGDTFKIKRVDTKCALQTVSGNFVAPPTSGGLLGVTNKLEAAMLLELVDLSSIAATPDAKPQKDLPTLTVGASSGATSEAQPASTTSTNQSPGSGQSTSPLQPPPASP
jgi:hypothetical protein